MNKVLIVLMFILLGTSLIVVSNMGKDVKNSFIIEYQNNKNLAFPDLEGKTEIIEGLYRVYDNLGVTVDYNIYNGIIAINGTATGLVDFNFTKIFDTLLPPTTYTYYYVSGTADITNFSIYTQPYNINNVLLISSFDYTETNIKTLPLLLTRVKIQLRNGQTFNNLQFKLQLEIGSHSTSYVVPKLIPVYKDNLTQQEKNEIGLGAFGGISKILKSIDNVIKPIGNFINGILNLFN